MSNEEGMKPFAWAKEKGLPSDVVLKLLRANGVEVRTAHSLVPQSAFEKIESAAAAEKQKIDARNAKKVTDSASVPEKAKTASSSASKTSTSGSRTLKVILNGPLKAKGTLKSELKRPNAGTPKAPGEKAEKVQQVSSENVKTQASAAKTEIKNETSQKISAAKSELKPTVKSTPTGKSNAEVGNTKQPTKSFIKPKVPSVSKPAATVTSSTSPAGQMLANTSLKTPAMIAQVFKPDAAILARIQKSQAAAANSKGNARRSGGNGNNRDRNSNQQGYTGSFGRSNNNGNNHHRNGNNGNNNGNRQFQNGQGGNANGRTYSTGGNGFMGGMQDAFGKAHGTHGGNNNSNNNSQHGKSRGKNDRNNNERNRREQQESAERQDLARQNVSRVMATLSKNPVKKTYHKEHNAQNQGEEKKIFKTPDFITVGELAGLMNQMPARVIAKCMEMGMMVTINGRLDFETIQVLADEFGYEAQLMEEYTDDAVNNTEDEKEENLEPRSPVVTVMGHVDHGKTSLLDWIRKSHVVAGESGGITQHIGAYEVTTPVGKVTFLDTPGHEAFSAMRARGSQVTDVIVLVVAADSMVMPQTVESIELAKREKVPLVVAITKIDLPTANPDKIRAQLAERGVEVEQWGGTTSCIEVSARSGQGMPELLETLALETEVLELRANPKARAKGAVVESKLDAGKGSMATILVQNGTLHIGDPFVCGIYSGRVRAMLNERGEARKEAGPSTPCQVLGFDGTPQAGDDLIVVEDEKTAREIASKRRMAARERDLRARQTISLESMQNGVKEGKVSELNLIVKADVGGSAEALAASLEKLSNREVKVNIIRKGVGAITDSDVLFATTAKAVIIAFHLMPSITVREMAAKDGIEIRSYRVIYDCIEDIQNVVEGLLKPTLREEIIGEAEIRELFKIPKVGTIAGCMVTDGEVNRDSHVRVYRNGVEIGTTEVTSLKRHKDDVKNVARGFECGIGLKGKDNMQVGDTLMFFKEVKVARTLADVAREEAAEKAAKEAADAKKEA